MTVEAQLVSAGIAVATGLAVALLVQSVNWLKGKRQRRQSLAFIRSVLAAFEKRLKEVQDADDGRAKKEQFRAAMWVAHEDELRVAALAHIAVLRAEEFISLMSILDNWNRLFEAISGDTKRVPPKDVYERYFADLRKQGWLPPGSTNLP